jgi:4-oxalocrotonate tautomerase
MPVINITMHQIPEEQKKSLVERLTSDAVDITKIPADRFTVLISELPAENIGCAGKTLKDLKAGR